MDSGPSKPSGTPSPTTTTNGLSVASTPSPISSRPGTPQNSTPEDTGSTELKPTQYVPASATGKVGSPSPLQTYSVMTELRKSLAQPVFASFLAGGLAGAVSRTVVSPLERLKILFQVQGAGRDEYKLSVGKGLIKMWKEEGWRGFMRGNGTNCVRIVPYSAVQFGSYNFYKRASLLSRRTHDKQYQFVILTYMVLAVFRRIPRPRPSQKPCASPTLWWSCGHHLSNFYISLGYLSHSTLDTICFLLYPVTYTAAATARHVENYDQHV